MSHHARNRRKPWWQERAVIVTAVLFVVVLVSFAVAAAIKNHMANETPAWHNDYDQSYGGVSNLSVSEVQMFHGLDVVGVTQWRQDPSKYESDVLHSVCDQLDQGQDPDRLALALASQHGYTPVEAEGVVAVARVQVCSEHK